eukprot:GEZU01025092.1.p1 GENE.GEZU01025092.1~~GEZU01025092.1.p1  ORF type:complete len:194 (-),score=22.46 GEZU01025092.1:64-645(-)
MASFGRGRRTRIDFANPNDFNRGDDNDRNGERFGIGTGTSMVQRFMKMGGSAEDSTSQEHQLSNDNEGMRTNQFESMFRIHESFMVSGQLGAELVGQQQQQQQEGPASRKPTSSRTSYSAKQGGSAETQDEKFKDLMVFGYSSRLFRDDDTAQSIHDEKHMLSYHGNDEIRIDRYDVRALLDDLSVVTRKKVT